jgi:hypothetical protein
MYKLRLAFSYIPFPLRKAAMLDTVHEIFILNEDGSVRIRIDV